MPVTRQSLLLRLRTNADPTSWGEFVGVYEPFLFRFLRSRGVPEHDAADLVQDIFVRLLRVLPGFVYRPARGRFRSWLKTLSRNMATDWRRKSARRAASTLGDADVACESAVLLDADWNAAHQRRVFEHALKAVRRQLTNRAWTCFEHYVLEGRSAAETAVGLGMQRGAVYVIAARVRERLRRKCLQFDEELDHGLDQLSG